MLVPRHITFYLRRVATPLPSPGGVFGLSLLLLWATAVATLDLDAAEPIACVGSEQLSALDDVFASEAWAQVVRQECLACHQPAGDAADTRLVFVNPAGVPRAEQADTLRRNRLTFTTLAAISTDAGSLLLRKAVGDLDHGGGRVLPPDSPAFRVLASSVQRLTSPSMPPTDPDPQDVDLFEGVAMLSNQRLLRRATLSLAGRLPHAKERQRVTTQGLPALATILDDVMREDAFYDRLREGFNDIFLTQGIDGNPDQTVLSYEHFEKTRGWYQRHDLTHIKDEQERRQAGYKLAREYRQALLDEPMQLIDFIVRNDRPFTEIVTADYIMVSPYTARGYGVFEELRDQFRDPDDPFEYLPIRLAALTGRSEKENQESRTGFYPHAGVLSTFQYLSRYPTTETNRNRLRARMYYQHFLGIDVLELASRGSDAAAATAAFEIPTMQAAECVVCHQTLDPVAGLFQDYWRFDANFSIYGRRHEGWFADMFPAGFEGTALPEEDRWRALQWLGEQTAHDPRFARTMAGHAYQLLTGRQPPRPPGDLTDPHASARVRSWQAMQCEVSRIAERFADTGYNFKQLLKDWILSDFYRADGLANPITEDRAAQLAEVGVVRLLSPEQLERKIAAIFGQRWGRLQDQTALLYGGIDSKEVTERATSPSGAMGAIQRTMANDVACKNVALDFSRPPSERRLFPTLEPAVVPGVTAEADAEIRDAMVHLHEQILGLETLPTDPAIDLTFDLLKSVVDDAAAQDHVEPQETWSCRQNLEAPVPDPHYTVRGWRAVVTYLLRQPEFLYE